MSGDVQCTDRDINAACKADGAAERLRFVGMRAEKQGRDTRLVFIEPAEQ